MRIENHWRSVLLFCVLTAAFIGAGLLMGGGSSRGYDSPNDDPRTVMVEVLQVDRFGFAEDDTVYDELLGILNGDGEPRMLTSAEFRQMLEIAARLPDDEMEVRTLSLVAQHNETSTTTSKSSDMSEESFAIKPSVLDDDILRLTVAITHAFDDNATGAELVFTIKDGTAVAVQTLAFRDYDTVSSILAIRATVVVK